MVDRSKVPEYQIYRVLYYSQPTQNKVVKTQSDPRRAPIWTLKLGRNNTYSTRCDRAVKVAIERGWCYEEEALGLLRVTELGEKILLERQADVEFSTTLKISRMADVI